jgi:hypothetical protein
MTSTIEDREGVKVLVCASDGKIRNDREAGDLIAEALGKGLLWVVLPVECFDDDFFRLKTRIAGEIVQKFVTYRRKLAIIGDISRFVEESGALRDFVYETNRGDQVWFLATMAEFDARLANLNS